MVFGNYSSILVNTTRPLVRFSSKVTKECNMQTIGKQYLDNWISTLKTKDPKKMVSLYHKNAVLLPTLDSSIRNTHDKIEEYFKSFLAKGPVCNVQEIQSFELSDSSVSVVGHYGFSFNDKSSANARFTYIFTKDSLGKWAITHHHSSLQP